VGTSQLVLWLDLYSPIVARGKGEEEYPLHWQGGICESFSGLAIMILMLMLVIFMI
jgi:hypothetical protein